MGKLYYIMGRSGVGKDSVVALIKDKIKMEAYIIYYINNDNN